MKGEEFVVLVEYQDNEGVVTGWDIWQYGRLIDDFHFEDGDIYADAYEVACDHAARIGFERLSEPIVEDWNDPIWRAYNDSADTDAGYMQTVDVFGRDED